MGSLRILIIGDWREQLDPLIQVEYIGNPTSPHIYCENIIDKAKKEFSNFQRKVKIRARESFLQWLMRSYRLNTLMADDNPDLAGAHLRGWIRLSKTDKIIEVILRNPCPHFLMILGSDSQFLLKPKKIGWDINECAGMDSEISQGYVSSARICDIDFSTMRKPLVDLAPTNWDLVHHIAAGRTWRPLKEIRKKYPGSDLFSEYDKAVREWLEQSIIKQLREDGRLANLSSSLLDGTMLPREEYVQHCVLHAPVLKYFDVLHQHKFFIAPDESDLLAGLNPETKLTSVIVKQ